MDIETQNQITPDDNNSDGEDFDLVPNYLLALSQNKQDTIIPDLVMQSVSEEKFQECDVEQILISLDIDEISRQNLKHCLEHYTRLLMFGQELSLLFGSAEDDILKAIQLSKLSVIGNMQIQQAIWLINAKSNPLMLVSTMKRFVHLGKYLISSHTINLTTMNQLIDFEIREIFVPLETLCKLFFQRDVKQDHKAQMREIKILLSKLTTIIEMFPHALKTHSEDLFCLDKTHIDWQSMYSKVLFKQLGTTENLKKSYDCVMLGILAANAMVHKSSEQTSGAMKGIVEGFGAIYYMINAKKGKERANELLADPSQEQAFKVWNLAESGMMKRMMPLMFQSICYNKKIYISRRFPQISKDYIMQQYKDNCINKITPLDLQVDGLDLPTSKQLFEFSSEKVCIRLLCNEAINVYDGDTNYQDQFKDDQTSTFAKKFPKMPIKVHDKIIIHIHGGGFVSMSSRSHQTYTRKWANNLQVPLFSIDYRKAPQYPYPAGLDDCWQAYLWIINYCRFYFNIDPQRVVLVGDSAGGNLVAALTIMCIKSGVRVPDGILLAYPALNLQYSSFTPSMLIALNDGLLPHTILRMCLQSYISDTDFDPDRDPLLSPTRVSDEILKLFPRTRIVVGTNDPLHDDSWRLAQRLIRLQKDFSMTIYPGMPHGFLSFDNPQGMKECKVTVEDSADILKNLLSLSNHQEQMIDYQNGKLNLHQQWNQALKQNKQ